MNLYEFVNPSDMITFYAVDDEIAQAVTIYIGSGKAMLRVQNDEREMPPTTFLFTPMDPEVEARLKSVMEDRFDAFLEAAHSFACCSFSDREIYDDYTSNGKNSEKVEKWHDKHLTSMSDFCKYARSLKKKETV